LTVPDAGAGTWPPGPPPVYPPGLPPPPPKHRGPLVALAVVVGVLVLAGLAYGGDRAYRQIAGTTTTTFTTSTSSTSSTSTSSTTNTTLGTFTSAEQALVGAAPFSGADCRAIAESNRVERSTASVACTPPTATDVTLEISSFASVADLRASYEAIRTDIGLAPNTAKSCQDGGGSERGWQYQNVTRGRLLCYYGAFRGNPVKLRVFWTNEDQMRMFKIIQDSEDYALGFKRFQDWSV
jgi:hypothetical protein